MRGGQFGTIVDIDTDYYWVRLVTPSWLRSASRIGFGRRRETLETSRRERSRPANSLSSLIFIQIIIGFVSSRRVGFGRRHGLGSVGASGSQAVQSEEIRAGPFWTIVDIDTVYHWVRFVAPGWVRSAPRVGFDRRVETVETPRPERSRPALFGTIVDIDTDYHWVRLVTSSWVRSAPRIRPGRTERWMGFFVPRSRTRPTGRAPEMPSDLFRVSRGSDEAMHIHHALSWLVSRPSWENPGVPEWRTIADLRSCGCRTSDAIATTRSVVGVSRAAGSSTGPKGQADPTTIRRS
jgi:hypothetical protein